ASSHPPARARPLLRRAARRLLGRDPLLLLLPGGLRGGIGPPRHAADPNRLVVALARRRVELGEELAALRALALVERADLEQREAAVAERELDVGRIGSPASVRMVASFCG